MSPDLAALFTQLTNVGLELYEQPALAVLPSFADLDGRAELNDMIQDYLSKPEHTQCPPPAVSEVIRPPAIIVLTRTLGSEFYPEQAFHES